MTEFGLAPDPAVPGRDVLLDPELVAARIGQRLTGGAGIEGAERMWASYAIGKRLRVLYRFHVNGRAYLVSASTFPAGRSEARYEQSLARAVRTGSLAPVLHDPWLSAVFWTFPNDRAMLDLELVMTPEGAGGLVGGPVADTTLVRWTPEKNAVIGCLRSDGGMLAYLKLYGKRGGARELATHEAAARFGAHPLLRVPRARALPERGALVLEAVDGPSVDVLPPDTRLSGYRAFGAAIAAMHTLHLDVPQTRLFDQEELRRSAGLISRMRPDVGDLAGLVADRLCTTASEDDDVATVHGDASPRNAVLCPDGRVGLIDLDDASRGPAALDLGRLLAVLRKRRLLGILDEAEEQRLGAAFLEGYEKVRHQPSERALTWHTAAALLVRCAYSAVKRVRPEGLAHLQPLLEEARVTLEARPRHRPATSSATSSATRPVLLMYCQHAQGVGHLVRSLALAGGLAERFSVHLLNGGTWPDGIRPPDGVEVIPLPPLGLSEDGLLVSYDRRRSVDAVQRVRRERVLEAYRSTRPDVVMVELFPFGRRKFAGEILLLLEEAHARRRRPLVVSSVRDILVGKGDRQEAHDERASLLANLYFDLVLVHADPRFARLEDTFSPATPMRAPVVYTGFVSARVPTRRLDAQRHGPVLVSVGGGGRSPEQLIGAAVEAHERNWPGLRLPTRIVAGPFYPEAGWHRLRAQVEGLEGIELRRTVPDLVDELGRSQASVSQCGYNTATELLLAGIPALVVPVAEGPEGEQLRRARLLERLGAVRVLEPGVLDGSRLAAEIVALRSFRPAAPKLDTNGVAGTVAALGRMLDRRVAPNPARPATVMPA